MAAVENTKTSEFIVHPKHRMEKWERMSKSLMKQAWQLSTLCHTPTCIVISPPIGDSSCSKFGMWPDNDGASLKRMIDLYNATPPNRKNKFSSSPTQTVVKARKKVKVNHDVDDQTTSVSCGLGFPPASGDKNNKYGKTDSFSSPVSCGGGLGLGFGLPSALGDFNNKNVGEAPEKKALQDVNTRMEQIQTRVDAEDNAKIYAILNADPASNGEKRDDLTDLWFLDFPDYNNATTTCDHQDYNNNAMDKQNVTNVADIIAPTGEGNQAQLAGSNILNEYSCHYFTDPLLHEDESFQNIFEQQQIIGQDSYISSRSSFYQDDFLCNDNNDPVSLFTNQATLTPLESTTPGSLW